MFNIDNNWEVIDPTKEIQSYRLSEKINLAYTKLTELQPLVDRVRRLDPKMFIYYKCSGDLKIENIQVTDINLEEMKLSREEFFNIFATYPNVYSFLTKDQILSKLEKLKEFE